MSDDYQRGYQKGYNAGGRRADSAIAAERESATQAVQRAERAEKMLGLGHCEGCRYWTLGGENCQWGYCSAPALAGTPFTTWLRAESRSDQNAKVITSRRFACVLFNPKVTP